MFFLFKKFSLFLSLYKELLKPSFSVFSIVFDDFCEVFGYSVITDFISTMFGFLKVLD